MNELIKIEKKIDEKLKLLEEKQQNINQWFFDESARISGWETTKRVHLENRLKHLKVSICIQWGLIMVLFLLQLF